MRPDISLVVPVYNVEKYIRNCLESIEAQTYKNFEVIIVNDGSPDHSLEIAKEFEAKDERFHVYSKENGGLSDARNFGLRYVKAKVVGFVDSDDWLGPDFLEGLYTGMMENKCLIAASSIKRVNNDHELLHVNESDKAGVISCREAQKSMLSATGITNAVWNKLYARKLIPEDPFPVGKLYEDEYVTYRIVDKVKKVFINNDVSYYYRENFTGISQASFAPRQMHRVEASNIRIEYMKEHHPDLVNDAERYLMHDSLMTLGKMDKYDPEYGKILRKNIAKTLIPYLLGPSSIWAKGFAGVACLMPRVAVRVYSKVFRSRYH